MIAAWAITLACAAAVPAPEAGRERVIVLDMRADGVAPEVARVVRDELVVELSRNSALDVLSSEDLRRTAELGSERAKLGCAVDDCMAEIGAALGARYVAYGSVTVVGSMHIIRLNLFDSEKNQAIARESGEASSLNDVPGVARAASSRLAGALRSTCDALVADSRPMSGVSVAGTAIGIAGLVVAAAGVTGIVLAYPHVEGTDDDGDTRAMWQTVGVASTVGAIVGGVALATGAVLFGVGGAE